MKFPAFIFSFLLFTIYYFLFTIPVYANTPPPNTNPNVPNNMHTYTQSVMVEVMAAMTCQLTGIDPVNPSQQCLGIDSASKKIGFVDTSAGSGQAGGAIGFAGNMIAVLYTPPLHTGDYFNYLAQNFGIAKPAYAATGFEGLSPLIKIWSAFRNIVYLMFVVVFVVIGLAIMLRLHIDPRTVMTIENQIPKIIIGLVMVTFSFAIAGFLIDMMYVSIYAVHGVIKDIPNVGNLGGLDPSNIQGVTPMKAVGGLGSPLTPGGINGIVNSAAGSVKEVMKDILGLNSGFKGGVDFGSINKSFESCVSNPLTCNPIEAIKGVKVNIEIANFGMSFANIVVNIISIISAETVGSLLHKIIGNMTALGTSVIVDRAVLATTTVGAFVATRTALIELLPWLLAYLVIFVAVLWALFRLWFQLIIAYIYILIDVVFAPFWILAGLFPGSPIRFGTWLRDIVANLSAFPVTFGMFLLGKVFVNAFTPASGIPPNAFVPPLIGEAFKPDILGSLIGIGIILMTPQVVTMMRDFLKAPNLKYTAAIGQAVGAGTGVYTGAAGTGGGLLVSSQFDITGQKYKSAAHRFGGILQYLASRTGFR